MTEYAVSLSDFSIQFGDQQVVSQASLSINSGEILCLLGPSGCGKTTLLKGIAGLLPQARGNLSVQGTVMQQASWALAPEKRNIGFIFQDYALFPHLSVEDNVGFGVKGKKEHKRSVAHKWLALVGLSEFSDRFPHQLSGGQQQRVAVARALATQPQVLLMDEPFSNIDTQVRMSLIQELKAMLREQGVTVVFVTHSRDEAFAFADRIAVMQDGKIVQTGEPHQVYEAPVNAYVARFLGEANIVTDPDICESLGLESKDESALLLRPHQLALEKGEQAEVIERVFAGQYWRYKVQLMGQEMIIDSPGDGYFAVGDRVKLRILSSAQRLAA